MTPVKGGLVTNRRIRSVQRGFILLSAARRPAYGGRVISWLGDFFRFWWSLLYWNGRKTLFRLGARDHTRCPCQNPSDSGLALQTRCEASATWNKSARFRRVCPLLVETPDGLRCSANTENVRPFWGRAVGCYAAVLLALYLAGIGTLFFVMRGVGYEVGLTTLLWPGRWSEVRTAQERMYALRAQQAMAAGNFQGAILALEMVCSLNPRNQAAALALANLWQVSGRAVQADNIYERLMAEFPERRVEIAQLWYRALLARADFARIKRLAAELLRADERNRAAWLHALFFAARQTSDPLPLNELLAASATLPDWCVLLLTIEHELLTGNMRNISQLTRVWAEPGSAYLPVYQVDRLISFGRHREALAALEGYAGQLPVDEAGFLRLRIYTLLGWSSLVETEAGTLLAYPMRPQLAAQFSAFLIRHPNRTILARAADRFVRDGPRPDGESFPVYTAVLLAAARCGDTQRAAYLADIIRQHASADLRAISTLGQLLANDDESVRIDRILPIVPLPTEMVYALLERYHRPAP